MILNLTEQEVNTILVALSGLPYKDSAAIINNIYAQANKQTKEATQEVEIQQAVDTAKKK